MTTREPYPEDPESPYFESIFALARDLDPVVTREQVLAQIREADPEDTLRISEPWSPSPERQDHAGHRAAGTDEEKEV
ncbi:MAG TPA: hypothetical protein VF468_21325 [Actinomycetota bacterium]|nr:hypothetical protein [Actinomycetota bacterium]